MILFQKRIFREDLRNNRSVFYIFGDNDQRTGFGGQAKEMRDEINSIGIRTKKGPYTGDVYYTDDEYQENIAKIDFDLNEIEYLLKLGKIVVFPSDGIGTGLANLQEYAPKTLKYIEDKIRYLAETY